MEQKDVQSLNLHHCVSHAKGIDYFIHAVTVFTAIKAKSVKKKIVYAFWCDVNKCLQLAYP